MESWCEMGYFEQNSGKKSVENIVFKDTKFKNNILFLYIFPKKILSGTTLNIL